VSQWVEGQHQLLIGRTVQERISTGHIDVKQRRIGDPGNVTTTQRGKEKTKASYRRGEWVDVYAVDTIQGSLQQHSGVRSRFRFDPPVKDAAKAAQEKMATSASRINHPETIEPELVKGWIKRAIQNELFDEFRRLQERISVAGFLGKVLIQVA
jgi:hypothetical protein